jgi:hypothetical protein
MEKRNINPVSVAVVVILVFVLLAIVTMFGLLWQSVQQAQQAIQPVSNLTSNIGTQVAQALHPTPTVLPDPVTIIHEVRSLARLETIHYSVEKVITAESGQGPFGFLFGDRLLLVAHGVVIAGVDLAKLSPQDLRVEDNVLMVTLPTPEIFVATLDNQKSYVYNRDTGILTKGDVDLETTARQAAEVEITKAALEDGILSQAQVNAENYLSSFFRQLGYPEVIFVQATPTPDD